ncbi:hypothetical protein QK289_03995 [Exiguobacterium antarcticum]|uniref:Uncharacterized protein n=1 Tax=Exiguobacterium antarcticum TaxID=132920 RepID=A0ABT6QZP9_9BACL|nr:hypothetical protein [Exiguobacterium antarcticum]MDI3234159.1 hypothetical protein [Exiguobacterium antarcticum]
MEQLKEATINHGNTLKEHEERIEKLEHGDAVTNMRVEKLEQQYHSLENTVMKEGRETREVFRGMIDKLIDHRAAATTQESEIKRMDIEVQDKRSARFTDLTGKLLGAGGIISLLAAALMQFFQK